MSVDFYLAVDRWPTMVEMQACIDRNRLLVRLDRFPEANPNRIVNDGILVSIGGEAGYLEGSIIPPATGLDQPLRKDRDEVAAMFRTASPPYEVKVGDYLVSMRIGSRTAELKGVIYLSAALGRCFGARLLDAQENVVVSGDQFLNMSGPLP